MQENSPIEFEREFELVIWRSVSEMLAEATADKSIDNIFFLINGISHYLRIYHELGQTSIWRLNDGFERTYETIVKADEKEKFKSMLELYLIDSMIGS